MAGVERSITRRECAECGTPMVKGSILCPRDSEHIGDVAVKYVPAEQLAEAVGPRREATCECCRRNDAPQGERLCVSCASHHQAAVALLREARQWTGMATGDPDDTSTKIDAYLAALDAARGSRGA